MVLLVCCVTAVMVHLEMRADIAPCIALLWNSCSLTQPTFDANIVCQYSIPSVVSFGVDMLSSLCDLQDEYKRAYGEYCSGVCLRFQLLRVISVK